MSIKKNKKDKDNGKDENLDRNKKVKGRVSMSKKEHKFLASIPLIGKFFE